jgi:hypothetical protein
LSLSRFPVPDENIRKKRRITAKTSVKKNKCRESDIFFFFCVQKYAL